MAASFGTEGKSSIPLSFQFLYGTEGTNGSWPYPHKINNLSNSGESVDGNYRISDMDIYFFDRYGTMFQNRFGNGTVGLGSSFQVIAHFGGTMDFQQQGAQRVWSNAGGAGGYIATIHTGKIHSISFKDRLIRIRSKSKMAHLNDLKWCFPIFSPGIPYEKFGSFAFIEDGQNEGTSFLGRQAFYDFDGDHAWTCHGYVIGTTYGPGGLLHVNGYPPMAGRGTGTLPDVTFSGSDPFFYAGTNSGGTFFYDEFEPRKFDGTFFGTFIGTINTDTEANYYGYSSAGEAEGSKSGTRYIINRTRLKANSDFENGGYIHFLSPIEIPGTPKEIFNNLLTGAMVNPLFTSSDIDTTTLNASGTNTAYFGMRRKVWYDEKSPLETIKDVINTTQALFLVNTNDKFEFRTYGPQNLHTTIPSLGTNDIISSEFNNDESDYYNRFVVRYAWNGQDKAFGSTYELKGAGWSIGIDRPLVLESKVIYNGNEAVVTVQRLKARYQNTFPHIGFRTNLNQIGLEVGTLLQITDPNSGLSGKTVQVVGYNKDLSNKVIDFECYDGEALYQRRGYARWEGDASLTNVVSGTSTSGWGTNGTVNNINSTIYGSQFSWW